MKNKEAPPLLGWYEHHVHPDIVDILRNEFKAGDIINHKDVYEKLQEVTGKNYESATSLIHVTKAMETAFPGIFRDGLFRNLVQKPGTHHKGHIVPEIPSEEPRLVQSSVNPHEILTNPTLILGEGDNY